MFAAQEAEQAQDRFIANGGTEWVDPRTQDPLTREVAEALVANIDRNADGAININEVLDNHEDFLGVTNGHGEL
jgi:hypothetical protein